MGLDMYAYRTSAAIANVDFTTPEAAEQIFYWRKHPNLHGWFEQLYRAKGGRGHDFNLAPVGITLEDLEQLERAVREHRLPETSGPFFGESSRAHEPADLDFIGIAREHLHAGAAVFYRASW